MPPSVSEKTLFELDETLERVSTPRLSVVLNVVLGLRWTDELPLPPYDKIQKTSSARYLSHAWSLPARQAWLSIRQKPHFPILEALAKRIPGAWAWQTGVAEHLQPAVWAGAAFTRDDRRKAPQVLANVLTQALESAHTSQERATRAAAIMGGGWAYATQLLAHWGPSGWDASKTWAPCQVGLLDLLLDPKAARHNRDNPWWRWINAADQVALTVDEREHWCELALVRAIESWSPFVALSGKHLASQQTFSTSVLQHLDSLDPWATSVPAWSPSVRAALETLVLDILRSEQNRGPVLIQDRNFQVLGVALRCLVDHPPVDVEFPRKVTELLPSQDNVKDQPGRIALAALRGYALRTVASLPSPQEPSPPRPRVKM